VEKVVSDGGGCSGAAPTSGLAMLIFVGLGLILGRRRVIH